VRIAVLTMSDTRSPAEDKSGSVLVEMIEEAGHELADRALVKDDVAAIRDKVSGWIDDPSIDVVITTGGTGFTGRDVTPEAVKPLFEKEIDGFSALFHMISYQKVETSTMQSRACGGVAKGTYIFCLPGSPGACRDAWNGILKWQLDNRHRPCNLVEIMPRLEEHRR
jgi:molybdenum cofactor biosynthesis protein B